VLFRRRGPARLPPPERRLGLVDAIGIMALLHPSGFSARTARARRRSSSRRRVIGGALRLAISTTSGFVCAWLKLRRSSVLAVFGVNDFGCLAMPACSRTERISASGAQCPCAPRLTGQSRTDSKWARQSPRQASPRHQSAGAHRSTSSQPRNPRSNNKSHSL
jgi:hypothetical protein